MTEKHVSANPKPQDGAEDMVPRDQYEQVLAALHAANSRIAELEAVVEPSRVRDANMAVVAAAKAACDVGNPHEVFHLYDAPNAAGIVPARSTVQAQAVAAKIAAGFSALPRGPLAKGVPR